ncbi:hypothetical protein P700755_000320 [Psychroflexus torquis ATCC 700755]|uniref:Uncharacterized protein n=1 Tax=Psychroflexus torquis (strain ATCC 700755 / CIP 106069 / ACAM 623) TaxID=313595 RepID=K4IBR0_PSYTT|nr:hypothetical protein P700755_000320 [Psychroflexus torquis ATCC 700755]
MTSRSRSQIYLQYEFHHLILHRLLLITMNNKLKQIKSFAVILFFTVTTQAQANTNNLILEVSV